MKKSKPIKFIKCISIDPIDCLDVPNGNCGKYLKLNNIYKVVDETKLRNIEFFHIKDELGGTTRFFKQRFKDVTRKFKLKRILKYD
jgi:hypothetical protein